MEAPILLDLAHSPAKCGRLAQVLHRARVVADEDQRPAFLKRTDEAHALLREDTASPTDKASSDNQDVGIDDVR